MGQRNSTQLKRSAVIEDADNIQISASPLHCPVCLNIFYSAFILPCGHTYCKSCLERLSKNLNNKDKVILI